MTHQFQPARLMHHTDYDAVAHKQSHKLFKFLSVAAGIVSVSKIAVNTSKNELVKATLVAMLILMTVLHMDPSNADTTLQKTPSFCANAPS